MAIQPKSKVLHERQFVYKQFLGRSLVRSSFSKISEDCGMFSNFIADFSKPGKPFSSHLCSFFSKIIADGTPRVPSAIILEKPKNPL